MRMSKPKSSLGNFLLVLTASLMLFCASCAVSNPPELSPESPSPSDLHVADTSTPTPTPLTPSPEKSPEPAVTEETDPFGNALASFYDDSKPYFPLIGIIKSEDIYLYGIRGNEGMILFHKGNGRYFDWPGIAPRVVFPQLLVDDWDSDGEKELAVIVAAGSGSGVATADLHIVKDLFDEIIYGNVVDIALKADDAQQLMSKLPFTAVLAKDFTSFDFTILGETYTIDCSNYFEEGNTFTRARFNDAIVSFEFEGNRIKLTVAVGAHYDNFATLQDFGSVSAYVIFDGENFSLEEHTFSILER